MDRDIAINRDIAIDINTERHTHMWTDMDINASMDRNIAIDFNTDRHTHMD